MINSMVLRDNNESSSTKWLHKYFMDPYLFILLNFNIYNRNKFHIHAFLNKSAVAIHQGLCIYKTT